MSELCGLPIRQRDGRWEHLSAGAEINRHAALAEPPRSTTRPLPRAERASKWLRNDAPWLWEEFPKRLPLAAVYAIGVGLLLTLGGGGPLYLTWAAAFPVFVVIFAVRTAMADHDEERRRHKRPRSRGRP